MGIDWPTWHESYGDPASHLAQRLAVVRRLIGEELDRRPAPLTAISLCAGAADDLIGALAPRPEHHATRALLVELHPTMADRARDGARVALLTGVEVHEVDAARSDVYRTHTPADIVLLCGVLGNVTDDDARRVVRAMAQLCDEGGAVIWTRHRKPPDLTPSVRAWFVEAGFEEHAFESPGVGGFAVGVHLHRRPPEPLERGATWFAFNR